MFANHGDNNKIDWDYPGGPVVKTPRVHFGDAGGVGLIPGWGNPLEKEIATHSSSLAWEIPWTEEPGGLQSLGSQESDMI